MVLATAFFTAMMAAVDLTIVSVVLPYIAGSLSASPDEILWVLTTFTIAQAVSVGISGKMALLLGRQRLCTVAISGFIATSALCGMSTTLSMMVVARFLQGVFTGWLIPTAQISVVEAYPEADRPRALSIWAIGVMAGPALGPAVGGYLAANFSWHWCFWVNIPIGVLALTLNHFFVRPVPATRIDMDWVGLAWLTCLVVLAQTLLDRGNIDDWWSSHAIGLMAIGSVVCGIIFIGRGIARGERNIIDITIYAEPNFLGCSLAIFYIGANLLAFMIFAPTLMIDILRWDPLNAGLAMGICGLGSLVSALLSSRALALLGSRLLVFVDMLLLALSWYLLSRVGLSSDIGWLSARGFLLEFALLLALSPLAARCFVNLRPHQHEEGAAAFNFSKTVGFSVGAALIGTLIYRGVQENWARHRASIVPSNASLEHLADVLGTGIAEPEMGAVLSSTLHRQAEILTLTQVAEVFVIVSLAALPLVLLIKPSDGWLVSTLRRWGARRSQPVPGEYSRRA